jgi:transcriptional regulatory protein LEU3
VFSSSIEPNTCYSHSPLLFWTIVAIGSRKYPKDPTLLSLLAPRVIELAQVAIFSRESTLETIQAFLLLCIWPMPVDTMHKDISPILSGAMLQLATSIGLHVQGVGQDFSRTTVHSDPIEAVSRAKLWVSCLIACQRFAQYLWDLCRIELTNGSTTCSNGLPPPQVFDTYKFQHGQRDPLIGIPVHLRFQRKLGQILATSATEIAHIALSIEHEGSRTDALTSMINIFSLQLTQLESECPDKLSEYIFA